MHYEAPEAGIAQLPQGWRSHYCRRVRLEPSAEPQGGMIVAAHYVAAGMVSIIRRVQAAPFAFDSLDQIIIYKDEPQWWDLGLPDPPPPGRPPRSYWRWWIAVESSDDRGNADEAEQPFPGQIVSASALGTSLFDYLSSKAPPAWPPSEVTGSYSAIHEPSAFYLVRGARWFVLAAEWDNRQLIQDGARYRIASSFGALEGVDIPIQLLSHGKLADILG